MQRPLLVITLSVVLSAAASLLVVTALNPPAAPLAPVDPAASTNPADAATSAELRALRRALDDLAMEVAELRRQRLPERRSVPAPAEVEDGSGSDARTPLTAMGAPLAGADVFKGQVAEALTQIEEEREARRWEAELEERREEATKAYAEYDELDKDLDTRLAKLQEALYLDARQVRDMRSLVRLQNDRNREMTTLWSAGNTSEEELGRIFNENRKAHRAEVAALLGPDQLGTYRKVLGEGGFGGRFSFFVGPWEDWSRDDRNGGK